MHVYLLSDKFSAEIPEVVLSDGCVPMMGNQTAMSETAGGLEVPITLEPAVWYKVLVLDSLSIDCSKKAIFWNSATAPFDGATLAGRRKHGKRFSESVYVGGECFGDESELEDVFDVVETLLHSYVRGDVTTRQFRAGIFRQLHCCVLPSIKLSTDDIANVLQAYSDQEKMVSRANGEILKRDQRMTVLRDAMQRQRAQFVAELELADDVDYPLKFARLLLVDVEQDLAASWQKLDELQQAVDVHKRGGGSAGDLAASRAARDAHLDEYNRVLAAKGALSDFMRQRVSAESELESSVRCLRRRGREAGRPLDNPLHAIYVEMNERHAEGLQELCRLADRKLLVLSVKEAIRATLDELRNGEDTCGIDVDRTGKHRATDVLRGGASVPREWLTLTEQISDLLEGSCPLADAGRRFLSYVLETCSEVLHQPGGAESKNSVSYGSESNGSVCESSGSVAGGGGSGGAKHCHLACSLESGINDDPLGSCKSVPVVMPSRLGRWRGAKPSRSKCANSWPFKRSKVPNTPTAVASLSVDESSLKGTCRSQSAPEVETDLPIHLEWFESEESDMVIIDTNREHRLKKTIELLKEDIQEHFTNMCRKIQLELQRLRPIHYRKIWLCYESHFYEQAMPCLSRLYEAAYASTVETLTDSLAMLTVSDMKLDQSIMVHMLEDRVARPAAAAARPCAVGAALREQPPELQLKSVTVHMPSSVTVIYDRRTWPLSQNLVHDSVECGLDALVFDEACRIDGAKCDKTLRLKAEWRERMAGAGNAIASIFRETSPLLRLKHITTCLRLLNQQVAALQQALVAQSEEGATAIGACSDDLVDALLVLLCNWDQRQVGLVYPHLNLLADLMAPFFEGGPYSFSLVQFSVAYQFVQNTLLLKLHSEKTAAAAT